MARKKILSKRERWKIARPFLVECIIQMCNYIWNMDEELKESEAK